ncbi:SusF/SusE family outer membrane protein [Carboxylicivirga sp. RSCT41]|uniref:SusF/SusE family outer membrane protein n=1 Tax=Carboxylicivirga agarovorans TaxID=3417570 RepID=UPI003D329476
MKYLNIFLALIFAAGFFTSCEDDMDPKVPGDAVSPVLEAPASGETYVLQKVDEENLLTSIVFSEADFKLDVVTEYAVEVDDADGNFEFRRVVATGSTSPIDLKVGTFNKSLLNLGYEGGEAHDIQLRVVAGNHLASDPITMNVTTYFDAEPWSVIGSAVGGWDTANDQFMSYDKANDVYRITLDMVPGDFKFRAPKKDDGGDPWKYNLGLDGGSIIIDNGENIVLKDGGDNVKCSGGNYTITLDVTNSKFTIVQNSAGEFTDWTDVVLDAVGTGVSIDNPEATADGSSWNWGNVLLPDNEGKPSADGSTYTWTWTGIVLEANEGFKLRTQNGEASPVNGMSFDVGFSAVDTENSSDKVADKDGNLSVTEKGEYIITIAIDAASGDAKKVTITEYVKYPTALYMTGASLNAVGDGGWNWDTNVAEFVPVHSHPNMFWAVVWLDPTVQDAGVKIAPEKAWGNDFGVTGDAVDGVWSKGGDNIVVPSAGYYTVVVDYDTDKIEANPAKIYGIGDCFGSWDSSNESNLFTIDAENKVIKYDGTVAAAELRMHVGATTLTADWWQAEFMILDGNIAFRGTGDDQDRVALTAGNAVITLDFINGTGTITQ